MRFRSMVLMFTALLAASGARAEPGGTEAVVFFVGDTYGCLGYPGWPGGIARLASAVRELRKSCPDAPLLHTGNAISPFYYSRFDKGRLYTESLDSIGNVVWNLGFHDADYGWGHLTELRKRMPHTTLLSSNFGASAGAPSSWHVVTAGGLRIGFAGLVDPRIERLKAIGLFEGLSVREPIEAARKVVREHRDDADVLVLVADLPEDDAERLAREVEGADVVISGSRHERDWYTFFQGRPPKQQLERTRPDGSRVLMLSGPRDGFALGKLTVRALRQGGKWRLDRLVPEVIELPASGPQDPQIWDRVATHLRRLESQASTPLVTGLQQRFPKGIDGERLTRWTVGAIREAVGAEVGVLNAGALFKAGYTAPECWKRGRVTDLDLDNVFWTDNHVVKVKLLGKNLQEIADDDKTRGQLRFSGVIEKDGRLLVNGRVLEPATHYLVAATNYLVSESARSRGFDRSLDTWSRFEPSDDAWEPASGGKHVLLREMFRERLLSWSKRHPRADGAEPFEPPAYPDQRSVVFRNLTLNLSDFDARGNQSFPRVRNPAISTGDVKTTLGSGEVFVRDDSLERRADRGLRYSFQSFEFPGNKIANPVDDFVLFERRFDRTRQFGLGPLGDAFNPYAELAYDSEFTATTGNPREQVYRLSAGLAQRRDGPLEGWRLSGLVEHDRSDTPNTEYGLGVSYNGSKTVWKLRLETDTRARGYFRSDDDTADDLLWEATSNNQLVVSITSELSVALMANLFAYRGKVVDEDGANLFVGVGFRFDKLWKPRSEPFGS